MFIKRLFINQQSFVNILNVSNSWLFRNSQKFSFPLHKGIIDIAQDNTMLHIKYNNKGVIKSYTSQIYELKEGKFILSIPCQDFECVLTTTQGSCIKVNWDQNDDLKNITLYNNEEFDNLVPCLTNEVPYLK